MIHITVGNGKLDKINSINTNPLWNDFCLRMSKKEALVCSKCYSIRTMKRWYNVQKPLSRNYVELCETILPKSELPTINALYFRFNSHGELINSNHLTNLFKVCRKNPKVQFAIWTKKVELIESLNKESIPDNLILVYSEPLINPAILTIPANFDKVFAVYTEDFAKRNRVQINCEKKCINCLKCYTPNNDEKLIRELIK